MPDPITDSAAPPRPLVRKRFLLLLLLSLPILALLWPKSFRWMVRHGLTWEARQQGVALSIGGLYGSLFEPLSFRNVQLETTSPQGVQTSARIKRADLSFSIRQLVFHKGEGWLRDLDLDGVNADFRVLPERAEEPTAKERDRDRAATAEPSAPQPSVFFVMLAPAQVKARRTNLRFVLSGDAIVFNGVRLYFNRFSPGGFVAHQIVVDDERFPKIFRNVTGSALWQDQMLTLVDVKLADDLLLTSAATDLGAFVRGKMLVTFAADAFGGNLRGELRDAESGHLNFEATGSFSRIQVDRLALFCGTAESAAGVIDDGRFTFRGSPRSPEKATMTVHLSSKDFRWGARRWDSFVFGATFLHRRLQIPELELRQAENTLTLRGDMTLPSGSTPWWKSEFDFEIAARLSDLGTFFALAGERFSGLSGKLTVDGSIRGENQFFTGQVIASGSKMAYRGAPIDSLEAAVKLHGNEVQVTNLELLHKDDFVRGKGVASILGLQQYSGEFNASIADLATYAALLQPPIAPRPFGGSVRVNWSGDGSATAHSGAFQAAFKQLRALGPNPGKFRPLNADIEATYSPGNVFLKRAAISDADTRFSATVTVSPAALHFQDLKLEHGGKPSLEGEALLPINIWGAWPHPIIDLNGKADVKLHAKNLELADALLLAGQTSPFDALIDLDATGAGPLGDLAFTGKLRARNIPLTPMPGVNAEVGAELQVAGTYRQAAVTGNTTFNRLNSADLPDLEAILAPIHPLPTLPTLPTLPPLATAEPFLGWTVQVAATAAKPLSLSPHGATFTPSLQITGTLGAPVLAGAVQFANIAAVGPHATLTLSHGTLVYAPGTKDSPLLQAEGKGLASGRAFTLALGGAFAQPTITLLDENGQPDPTLPDRIRNGEPAPTPNAAPLQPTPMPSPSAAAL